MKRLAAAETTRTVLIEPVSFASMHTATRI